MQFPQGLNTCIREMFFSLFLLKLHVSLTFCLFIFKKIVLYYLTLALF